jgi:hypothetical protein
MNDEKLKVKEKKRKENRTKKTFSFLALKLSPAWAQKADFEINLIYRIPCQL